MNKYEKPISDFLENTQQNPSHRFKSWELCHNEFLKYKDAEMNDDLINHLSLNLTAYLASWGMYRASSFLLQDYAYTVHNNAVRILMQYPELFSIDPIKDKDKYLNLILGENGVYNKLEEHYSALRDKVRNTDSSLSKTLVTKILLGCYGCMPAYDRFFISGLSEHKIPQSKQGRPNLEALVDYLYNNNEMTKNLQNIKQCLNSYNQNYTFMKLVDMYFWQVGKDKDKTASEYTDEPEL